MGARRSKSPGPWAIFAAGWTAIALRLGRGAKRHHATVVSAGVAFFGFVSLFPALAAIVSAYGLLADPTDVSRQVDALTRGLPQQIREVLQAELARLTARSSGTLSVEVAVGIVLAVWAATKGAKSLITALTMAFDQEETRGHVRMAVIAFGFTAGALTLGLFAVAATIALPAILGHLGLSAASTSILAWIRWPALAAVMMGALALLYRYGPSHRPARWRWISPGSVLATASWLVGSALFSWSASRFAGSKNFDGTLGAILLFLSWFFLSSYIVILGAELDAEIDHLLAAPGAPRPF